MTSNFGRHISFVRTSIRVFLDSMKSPLSQKYIHIPEENIRCLTEVIYELVTSGQLVNPGQLVRFAYVWPPTSEGQISFVRTPIWVFLDSMESPLSQEYIHIPEEKIRCLTKVIDELVTSGQLINLGQLVRFAYV